MTDSLDWSWLWNALWISCPEPQIEVLKPKLYIVLDLAKTLPTWPWKTAKAKKYSELMTFSSFPNTNCTAYIGWQDLPLSFRPPQFIPRSKTIKRIHGRHSVAEQNAHKNLPKKHNNTALSTDKEQFSIFCQDYVSCQKIGKQVEANAPTEMKIRHLNVRSHLLDII